MKSSDHLHFIGIGGIGMSGVAQFCRSLGCRVTGSDRDADKPENRHIFAALRHQGLRIYPQDGSFRRDGKPDWLIYSTAVEEGNPDFKADPTIPRLHRATALAAALELNGDVCQIAVSGSCGKTTVTAYLAEALRLLGLDAGCLDGGLVKAFRNDTYCGNFHPGKTFFVYEADESDKSLVAFSPDFALVLNIGTDHYDREELIRVFGEFLKKVGTGVVLSREVYQALAPVLPPALTVSVFDTAILNEPRENVPHFISNYQAGDGGAEAEYDGAFTVQLPQPGFHTALNLLAAGLLLELLNIPFRDAVKTLAQVHGVARRFDCRGRTATGAFVYDDYAHNPEKIACCIRAAQEMAGNHSVRVAFQPHGYRPLGFMRDEIFAELRQTLRPRDRFVLLEPFYAGGTSAFRPTAAEVVADWQSRQLAGVSAAADRPAAERILSDGSAEGDVIVVMGARDNSLTVWADSLTQQPAAGSKK